VRTIHTSRDTPALLAYAGLVLEGKDMIPNIHKLAEAASKRTQLCAHKKH